MGRRSWLLVLGLSVGIGACAGAGSDPHDAPGCPPGSRRCDGDVMEVCVLDAQRRAAVWVEVLDCAVPDRAFSCVETVLGDAPSANCELVDPEDASDDAGVLVTARTSTTK